MQQDRLLKRDELARAHQLGEVQKEYPFRFEKWRIALGGGLLLGLLVFGGISALISHGFEGLLVAELSFLAVILCIGLALGGVFYYYRNAYVCIYTDGLIYLFRNKERAVRWEQIREVSPYSPSPGTGGGTLLITVQDEPFRPIYIPFFNKELFVTIQREVETHRRSGQ